MNFTVYRSSAGSGKTYTLVKEYLKIALSDKGIPPQKYKHILAITFTNKASAEMKERVILSLKELSSGEQVAGTTKYLLDDLVSETSLGNKDIKERAKKVLEEILHNYSDFAISTIDSFVHKIVRTFARDLHIPLNFDVEMDEDSLLSKAIDLLIDKVGTDKKLTHALVEFTQTKTDDEKSWHIENDLHNFARNLLKEDGLIYIEKLRRLSLDNFFEVRKSVIEYTSKFENQIKKIAEEGWELIQNKGLEHPVFYYGDKGIGKYFENLASGRTDIYDPNTYVQKTVNEDKWCSGKANETDITNINVLKDELTFFYDKIQKIINAQLKTYNLFILIRKNIYSLAVLNEIEKIIEEIKEESNIVHISEFNKKIAGIVMREPAPFIYERIGEHYNHYLIDEFQDTSMLQWQNLLPLVENSLATGNYNMVVGDAKQAIYRWRSGEVEQLVRLPGVYRHIDDPLLLQREDALKRNYKPEELNCNFRSKANIVEFNNWFFNHLAEDLSSEFQNIYKGLKQDYKPGNTGGYVRIEISDEIDTQISCERIHEIINEVVKDNYKLNDIAILCRKNSDASEVARYLLNQGIDVISSQSLLLGRSPDVNFLISFFCFLCHPLDKVYHTEILQYLINKELIKADIHKTLSNLFSDNSETGEKDKLPTPNSGIDSNKKFPDFLTDNGYEINTKHLTQLPLYELAEEIIRIFCLNQPADPFIAFFLDAVLNYSVRQNNDLTDFLEWWEEKKDNLSIVAPEGSDAVYIMTIHKAKGLEFPVVIFPFANWKERNAKDNLWLDIDEPEIPSLKSALLPAGKALEKTRYGHLYQEEKIKSLLDNFNILYVAFTRPEERLYVLTSKPAGSRNFSKHFIEFLTKSEHWDEERSAYVFGTSETKQYLVSTKEKPNAISFEQLISKDWKDRIGIRKRAPEIWEVETSEEQKTYGNLIHTALSRIKTLNDVEPELEKMKNEGYLTVEEKDELNEKLNSLLNLDEIKPFFREGLKIKAEADILLPSGDTCRPDRVIIDDNKAVVIDYKTGKEEEKHKIQLNKYGNVLKEMGYTEVDKYLLYIQTEKIVEV
ncbi:MAG: UvrD-helicase domain-containing protein [Bacteroidota bacterium]